MTAGGGGCFCVPEIANPLSSCPPSAIYFIFTHVTLLPCCLKQCSDRGGVFGCSAAPPPPPSL